MSSRIGRTAPLASGWDIELVDVDEYLARVGHPRVAPTADALRSLHEAHVRTIPFENVDVLLGSHRGLGLDAISDKLVRRRRGGYCFEHALLFAAVAEQLGYQMTRLISRVQPHRAGPRTHMSLKVRAEDTDYLVDVGFGAGLLTVMRLEPGLSRRLIGDTLTEEHADGRLVQTPIPLEALEDTLRSLDVVLDRGELAELRARIGQRRDSEPDA